jgi:hypothetical protein
MQEDAAAKIDAALKAAEKADAPIPACLKRLEKLPS